MIVKSALTYIKKNSYGFLLVGISTLLFLVGSLTGESFDDAAFAQHGQFFYYMGINPLFYNLQGAFYTWFLIGGYFIAPFIQLFGFSNIISMQLAVKFPLILAGILTSIFINIILQKFGYSKFKSQLISLIFLSEPVSFLIVGIQGTPLVLSTFLIVAFVAFLQRGNKFLAAILLGISASMYLYPLFTIPFLIRYLWIKYNKRTTLLFLVIMFVIFAIGFLLPLFVYKIYGIKQLSSTSISVVYSFFSPIYLTGGSFFDFIYLIHAKEFIYSSFMNFAFLISIGGSSILLAIIPRFKFYSLENLVLFLTLQALLFILFNPSETVQYIYASIPLLLICFVILDNENILFLITLATIFDFLTVVTWNPTATLGLYFADTNPTLLSYTQSFPLDTYFYMGFLYGSTILVLTLYILKDIILGIRKSTEMSIPTKEKGEKGQKLSKLKGKIEHNVVAIIVITSVVLLLVSPAFSDLPHNFQKINSINEQIVQPNRFYGSDVTHYTFQPIYLQGLDKEYFSLYNGTILLNGFSSTIYEYFGSDTVFLINKSTTMSMPINFPYEVSNVSLKLAVSGDISPPLHISLYNSTTRAIYTFYSPTSTSYSSKYNFDYLYYNLTNALLPAKYSLQISDPSNSSFRIFGSIGLNQEILSKYGLNLSDINPLTINQRTYNNSTLALLVTGMPVFEINNQTLPLSIVNNQFTMNITNGLASAKMDVSINGNFNGKLILTLYLPASKYISTLNPNKQYLYEGFFMFFTMIAFLYYLTKKIYST